MKVIIGLIGGLSAVAVLLALSGNVNASQSDWSWSAGYPSVNSSTLVSGRPSSGCPSYQRKAVVEGTGTTATICLFDGETMRFGTYRQGSTSKAVVGFAFDSKLYPLEGVCQGPGGCLYAPMTDSLVERQYIDGVIGVRIYRHFFDQVSFQPGTASSAGKFVFQSDTADYVLADDNGVPYHAEALALSSNGEWLAVELHSRGTALVNLQTFQARRILAPGYQYGVGMDPTEEMAVSDDGRVVVVVGQNVGFVIAEVTPECGQMLGGQLAQSFPSGTNRCRTGAVDVNAFIDRFWYATNPRLDRAGGRLDFYAYSYNGEVRRVSLNAIGYPSSSQLDLLALGDSFSSGEGETDVSQYVLGTNEQYENCHVSNRSYPFIMAASMGIQPMGVKSVACSGARITDVVGDDRDYLGQNKRLGLGGLGLPTTLRADWQTTAIDDFNPGRVHQERFAERYLPKVLTVGIGGNDGGLMDKLSACAMPGSTCEWAASSALRTATAREIQALGPKLADMYRQLQSDSPTSLIYAVGYPQIMSADGVCDPVTGALFNQAERTFVNENIRLLNQVIRAAATGEGVRYVDVEHSLDGYRLCDNLTHIGMNSLRYGDDISLLDGVELLRLIGSETFHPTPFGHGLMAQAIHEQYPDMLSPPSVAQAVDSETLAGYWGDTSGAGLIMNERFATLTNDGANQLLQLASSKLFTPGSSVAVEIHSDPQQLGVVAAGQNGQLQTSLLLPADLTAGYHTVHLYGTALTGEPIDLYQVIAYVPISQNQSSKSVENDPATVPLALSNQPIDYGDDQGADVADAEDSLQSLAAVLGSQNQAGQPGADIAAKLPAGEDMPVGAIANYNYSYWWVVAIIIGIGLVGLLILYVFLL